MGKGKGKGNKPAETVQAEERVDEDEQQTPVDDGWTKVGADEDEKPQVATKKESKKKDEKKKEEKVSPPKKEEPSKAAKKVECCF
jgi:hypothetical protein